MTRKETIAKKWVNFLNDRISEFDYTEIDTFIEDNNLNEDEIEYINSLSVKVTLGE